MNNTRFFLLLGGFLVLCAAAFCALPPELDPRNYAPYAKNRPRPLPPQPLPHQKMSPQKQQKPPPPNQQDPSQMKADDRPTTQNLPRPTPNVPLYVRFPPGQVVVGEVGDAYVLTRQELMKMARTPATFDVVAQQEKDPLMVQTIEGQITDSEATALKDWAVTKTFALIATKEGIRITDEELDARTKEASEGMPVEQASGKEPTTAFVVAPEVLRAEMRDGLLADAFIQKQVRQFVSDEQMRAIYDSNPTKFMIPPQVHVWQIIRLLPANLTKEDDAAIRKAFAKVRKTAARNNGEDFEKVALEENPRNKDKQALSGDIGWVDAGTGMPEALIEVVRKLKIGEVSEVIETQGQGSSLSATLVSGRLAPSQNTPQAGGALHILRVTERRDAEGATYDDFSRQRVLDYLMFDFRKQYGDLFMRRAPFPVRMNPTGLRLVTDPPKKWNPPPIPENRPPAALSPAAPGNVGNR